MPRKPKPEEKPESEELTSAEGRFSYAGLDRVLHERARLGILASLAGRPEGLPFNDLKRLCALTDGNLNRHLAVLSEAGLVETRKGTEGPRSQTLCRLTPEGRGRFAEYIAVLERVVADAQANATAAARGAALRRLGSRMTHPPLFYPPALHRKAWPP